MALSDLRLGSLVLAALLASLASASCGGSSFSSLATSPGDGGASSGVGVGSSGSGSSAGSTDGGSSGMGPDSGVTPAEATIGGTVSGLNGTLGLQDSGGGQVTISRDGSFVFPQSKPLGSNYDVTVASQPDGQVCTVNGEQGKVTGTITSVQVTCTSTSNGATYTIGGTVFGVGIANLVLQNNGGDDLSVSQAGTFTFSHPLPDGAMYDVMVSVQPQGPTCSVQNGSGTVSGANVTNVTVVCR